MVLHAGSFRRPRTGNGPSRHEVLRWESDNAHRANMAQRLYITDYHEDLVPNTQPQLSCSCICHIIDSTSVVVPHLAKSFEHPANTPNLNWSKSNNLFPTSLTSGWSPIPRKRGMVLLGHPCPRPRGRCHAPSRRRSRARQEVRHRCASGLPGCTALASFSPSSPCRTRGGEWPRRCTCPLPPAARSW